MTDSAMVGAAKKPARAGLWATWAALLRTSWRTVRTAGAPVLLLILTFHVVILVIGFPVLRWLFREALRASGMVVLDFAALKIGGGLTLTFVLILVIGTLAFWLAALQFALLFRALRRAQLGHRLTIRDALHDVVRMSRKLVRPSTLPLVGYIFVILPLSGFGFTSALAQGITLPNFISGELMKSQVTAVALSLFFLALLVLSVRWALAIPLFALSGDDDRAYLRRSWTLTGRFSWLPLVGAIAVVLIGAAIITFALLVIALIPTAVSDEVTPDASATIAAISLGAAQVIGAILTAIVTMLIGAILLALLDRRAGGAGIVLNDPTSSAGASAAASQSAKRRMPLAILVSGGVIVAIGLGIVNLPVMLGMSQRPDTLVLGHRGFGGGGVENTISGLEAAKRVGADLVEMDVMQTKDGGFVAMHDANLGRLAGQDLNVKDLTLDEIVGIEVHDLAGHTDRIPSFSEYVTRAAEIDMPLLIEIKLGGADTPDHVDRLVRELESLGALERNIYHSLDASSVQRLKALRPDLTVGYTMAFAAIGVPDTAADFIVVEEWSATEEMQQAAERAGVGFMTWTVNDEARMREHFRRDVDGIITDDPDIAVEIREEQFEESGLADRLIDAFTRFVTVF